MRRRQGTVSGKAALQVLDRAFGVLDLFAAQTPEWSVTNAAQTLGLPLSTTHRILGVLLRHGYVSRDPATKRFRLGIAAVDLGVRGRSSIDPQAVFVASLRALSKATGETAMLCTLDAGGAATFCVDRIESSEPLRLSVEPGRTLPLHAGAMGKAILAFLPRDQQDAVLSGPLERLCTRTITDRRRLRSDLDEIAQRGYAMSFEETNPGVWGAAVPILDARGYAYASIGTAGPLLRYAPDLLAREVASCHEAARVVASALGLSTWQPPAPSRSAGIARPLRRRAKGRPRTSEARVARVARVRGTGVN